MAYPYLPPGTNQGFVKRAPYGQMHPSSAPRAVSGKAQPQSGVRRVKSPKVTAPKRPTIPQAPQGITEQALIDAAVRSRFGPQDQALNQQLNQNARFSSGTGDWYAQALKEIQGLRTQGQQQSQQTLQGIQSYNSQPTLQNPTDQAAATARNNLNAEFAAMFGQNANSNSEAMNRIAAALVTQQGNTRNQSNVDRQRLLQQQGNLGQQKADYGLTYGAQLQQSQNKALMDQALLKVKQDTVNYLTGNAQSLASDRKAGQKVARTNARTQRKNAESTATNPSRVKTQIEIDYFNKHGRWPSTGPGGSPRDGSNSTYTKSKIQAFRANWDFAQATAHQLKEKGTYTDKSGKVQNITSDAAYSALLNATKDPDIAKAAAFLAFGKTLPPELLHTLAVKGVHPPRLKVGRVTGGGPYGTGNMG